VLRERSHLAQNVIESLSPDGLLIASTGTYPLSSSRYVPMSMYFDSNEKQNDEHTTLLDWTNTLLGYGTIKKSIEYSELVPKLNTKSLQQPLQRFNILMKDKKLMANWIASDAEINLAIQKLMLKMSLPNVDQETTTPILQFFDGASMNTYEFPSRLAEDICCKDTVNCYWQEHGYDPYIPNIELDKSLEVRISTSENGGRGVFATKHIPYGSYLGLEETVQGIYVPPNSYALLELFSIQENKHKVLCFGYLYGYGWFENTYVSRQRVWNVLCFFNCRF
jgi:hypothetical protein